MKAADVIRTLDLSPLPNEGGFYRETYRSPLKWATSRSAGTAIYYLVTPEDSSALHRLKFDEIFHFYAGDPVEMLQIDREYRHKLTILGSNVLAGEIPQVVVPGGTWQGTRLKDGGHWALLGTTMAPGFEFADFELADLEQLVGRMPGATDLLRRYIR